MPQPARQDRQITPYLLTATIALLVQLLCWKLLSKVQYGDELRYLDQASNWLLGLGFYPEQEVINPPLLPWILAQGQLLGLESAQLPILSILALVLAALLLRAALAIDISSRWATVVALLIVLHPVMLQLGHELLSEPFAMMASSLLCFAAKRLCPHEQRALRWLGVFLMGAAMAMLAMLKAVFGYAFAFMLCVALILLLLRSRSILSARADLARFAFATALALLLCTPFLRYMHGITGEHFSWSTETGDHFYWMTVGGEDIWGSWYQDEVLFANKQLVELGYADEVRKIRSMPRKEGEAYAIAVSMERLRESPMTYVRNVIANAGRLFFNYPYTLRPQSLGTFGYILPNMMLILAVLLLLPASWQLRSRQNHLLILIMLFYLVYCGGNLLVATTGRQSLPLIPFVLVWVASQWRLMREAGMIHLPGSSS